MFGTLFGQTEGIHGRIDHFYLSSKRLAAQKAVARTGAGHPQQVPVADDDDPGIFTDSQNFIDGSRRGDAHRTAGAGDQADFFWQKLL